MPLMANAGVGAVIPFDARRREKYPGSLSNYVIVLRATGSLRKRLYFLDKAVVATLLPFDKEKNKLALMLSRQFGDGTTVVRLSNNNKSFEDYVSGIIQSPLTRPSNTPIMGVLWIYLKAAA